MQNSQQSNGLRARHYEAVREMEEMGQVEEVRSKINSGDNVDRLDIGVRWDPPLTVLYDLSYEEATVLEAELYRLVESAVAEFVAQNAPAASGVRYRVQRDAHGPAAQAVEFVRVVLEDLPVELAAFLVIEIAKPPARAVGKTMLGKLRNLTRRAGTNEIAPTLEIESPREATPIDRPVEQDASDVDANFAPTDGQLDFAPLVYIRTNIDVNSVHEEVWGKFADYGASPIPEMFRELLYSSFVESADSRLPRSYFNVVIEDRPPREDALFPVFYVDLSAVLAFLRTTIPEAVVDALIAHGLISTWRKLQSWTASEQLPSKSFYNNYNAKTLELLCLNYVRLKRHPRARLSVKSERFNTRTEYGYEFPIDPEVPMGWKVEVRSRVTSFAFVVDSDATIRSLTYREAGETSKIHNADLRSPESDSVTIPRRSRHM